MAEVTIRRYGELSRGVFAILMDEPEGLPAQQILQEVEASVPPPRSSSRRMRSIPAFAGTRNT
jgi:hypothetical protein